MAIGDSEDKKWYKDKEKMLPALIAIAVRARAPAPGAVFPVVHGLSFYLPLLAATHSHHSPRDRHSVSCTPAPAAAR